MYIYMHMFDNIRAIRFERSTNKAKISTFANLYIVQNLINENIVCYRFEWIRTSMAYLPTEAPSRPATATSISTMSSDRPVSRSGQ